MTGVYKTPARMVRTGQVISVPQDGYRRRLEVEIVHHELREVDGERIPAVSFTGWSSQAEQVEQGWAQFPETLVLVVEDRRGADCFKTVYTPSLLYRPFHPGEITVPDGDELL